MALTNSSHFKKLLNFGLLIFFLVGYLEWGQTESTYIFRGELDVLQKLFTDPMSVLHPLILIPFGGQLILLFTIFQNTPSRRLTLIGLACLSILILVIFLIGVMGLNFKMLGSTLPFIITGILVLKYNRKKEPTPPVTAG